MTTTVTIKHEGPLEHRILVEIVRADGDGLIQETTLEMGESFTTFLYASQSVHINELT